MQLCQPAADGERPEGEIGEVDEVSRPDAGPRPEVERAHQVHRRKGEQDSDADEQAELDGPEAKAEAEESAVHAGVPAVDRIRPQALAQKA